LYNPQQSSPALRVRLNRLSDRELSRFKNIAFQDAPIFVQAMNMTAFLFYEPIRLWPQSSIVVRPDWTPFHPSEGTTVGAWRMHLKLKYHCPVSEWLQSLSAEGQALNDYAADLKRQAQVKRIWRP
jgi:hypothetical protein